MEITEPIIPYKWTTASHCILYFCYHCHTAKACKGGLLLDSTISLLVVGNPDTALFVTGSMLRHYSRLTWCKPSHLHSCNFHSIVPPLRLPCSQISLPRPVHTRGHMAELAASSTPRVLVGGLKAAAVHAVTAGTGEVHVQQADGHSSVTAAAERQQHEGSNDTGAAKRPPDLGTAHASPAQCAPSLPSGPRGMHLSHHSAPWSL